MTISSLCILATWQQQSGKGCNMQKNERDPAHQDISMYTGVDLSLKRDSSTALHWRTEITALTLPRLAVRLPQRLRMLTASLVIISELVFPEQALPLHNPQRMLWMTKSIQAPVMPSVLSAPLLPIPAPSIPPSLRTSSSWGILSCLCSCRMNTHHPSSSTHCVCSTVKRLHKNGRRGRRQEQVNY